jgi:hypothetical protein
LFFLYQSERQEKNKFKAIEKVCKEQLYEHAPQHTKKKERKENKERKEKNKTKQNKTQQSLA